MTTKEHDMNKEARAALYGRICNAAENAYYPDQGPPGFLHTSTEARRVATAVFELLAEAGIDLDAVPDGRAG